MHHISANALTSAEINYYLVDQKAYVNEDRPVLGSAEEIGQQTSLKDFHFSESHVPKSYTPTDKQTRELLSESYPDFADRLLACVHEANVAAATIPNNLGMLISARMLLAAYQNFDDAGRRVQQLIEEATGMKAKLTPGFAKVVNNLLLPAETALANYNNFLKALSDYRLTPPAAEPSSVASVAAEPSSAAVWTER